MSFVREQEEDRDRLLSIAARTYGVYERVCSLAQSFFGARRAYIFAVINRAGASIFLFRISALGGECARARARFYLDVFADRG